MITTVLTWLRGQAWIATAAAALTAFLAALATIHGVRTRATKAGATEVQLKQTEEVRRATERMLEATTSRPRDRDALVERLRQGGF